MRCGNCGRELPGNVSFCPTCGTPVAPAPFSAPAGSFGDAPRPPLSGAGQPRKKSGCWKALIILLIVGALALLGLGLAGYFGFRYAEDKLKSSEAYKLALKTLKENPEVAEKMGEVGETGFPVGAYNEAADGTGTAAFTMSVKGSKASGQYEVAMTRRGGQWRMRTGQVRLAGGDTITISPVAGTDEAPEPPAEGDDSPPIPPPLAGKGGAGGSGATTISGGVLNGKAISKPAPPYPAIARAARASGVVVVQVTVDEGGKVTSASAVSGHPLLRAAAEAAARQARFSPTLLSGRPVKVTGTITYNFELPQQ